MLKTIKHRAASAIFSRVADALRVEFPSAKIEVNAIGPMEAVAEMKFGLDSPTQYLRVKVSEVL